MAPPKKCNAKPFSSIENSLGPDAVHHSNHGNRNAASAGTENRRAGTVAVPDSSRGRTNGRVNGTNVSGRGSRGGSPVENTNGDQNLQRSNGNTRPIGSAGFTGRNVNRGVTFSGATPTSPSVAPDRNTNFSEARTRSRPPQSRSATPVTLENTVRQGILQSSNRASRPQSRGRLPNSVTFVPTDETRRALSEESTAGHENHRDSIRAARSSSRGGSPKRTTGAPPFATRPTRRSIQNSAVGHHNLHSNPSAVVLSHGRVPERVLPNLEARRSSINEINAVRGSLQQSTRTRIAASPGTQNLPTGSRRRDLTAVLNSSSERSSAKVVTSSNAIPEPSDASHNRNNNVSEVTAQSRRSQKRSHPAAALSTENRTSTRYVMDDEDSQPSTSSAPPRKIHRAAPTEPTRSIGNSSSRSGFKCCKQRVPIFKSYIRFCDKGCEIEIGEKYRTNTAGKVYCLECFDEKMKEVKPLKESNWKELENKNESTERTLTCKRCGAKWHQCCSLELQYKNFICNKCLTSNDLLIRTTLLDHSKNNFETSMANKLNSFLNDPRKPLSVVSYTQQKRTPMDKIVPSSLHPEFSNAYTANVQYNVRIFYVFQRLEGVDVLVFAMSCHEYNDILGRSWAVIDYLDSVPYAEGRGINMEAIISYFAWAKEHGFNHAHFFSCPPNEGTDYILSNKPELQLYRDADNLLGYYNALLEKGKRRGIFVDVRTLEDELRRRPYAKPTDFLPFDGGLWPNCMKEFDEEITKKSENKLPTDEYMKKFTEFMMEKFDVNGKNNFFIDLNVAAKSVSDPDSIKHHSVLGDRDTFLDWCRKKNWEFSSLRRAKFTSVGVIEMIMGAADQKKRNRGMELMF